MAKKRSTKASDFELLTLQVRRLANELDGVGNRLKGVALTDELVRQLIGELRAVRHLLDKKGQFAHLDFVVPAPPPPKDPPASACPLCGKEVPAGTRPAECPSCQTVIPA